MISYSLTNIFATVKIKCNRKLSYDEPIINLNIQTEIKKIQSNILV